MLRRFVSLTLTFSFFLLVLSSVVLYVVPEGRVAYWSDWTMLSFSKEQWGAMHITGGLLFLLFSFWHVFLKIRPLKAYVTGRHGPVALFGAVLTCALCYAATLEGWQPARFVLDLNQSIKVRQEQEHGTPPYGHAEKSSLSAFCSFLRLDGKLVEEGLKAQGLEGIEPGRTLEDMAAENGLSPASFYRRILQIPGVEPAPAGQGRGRRALMQ